MVSVEEHSLTDRYINDTIFAIFSCLVKRYAHLCNTREGKHEVWHYWIADWLVGLAEKQVGDILTFKQSCWCELWDTLFYRVASSKDILYRSAQMVVDFNAARTCLYAQLLKSQTFIVDRATRSPDFVIASP